MGLKYPFGPEASEDVTEDDLRSDIMLKLRRLETILGQLGFYGAADGVDPVGVAPDAAIGADTIFLVHGRDDAVRLSVGVVFSKCVSSPYTILDEQVNGGITIIEKLESHLGQGVNYAVVLMTGDDEGALRGESPKPRALQNVVLELGYAMAALGRQRVCVLCSTGLELPSDVSGVTYIPLDERRVEAAAVGGAQRRGLRCGCQQAAQRQQRGILSRARLIKAVQMESSGRLGNFQLPWRR
ncbi:TIR domain-containing protein [Arsenicicoccus bolidensis]|uniref:Nucleotide-binding protein n=1 Tax=Arsenicicoccus bolidensis TaxID=229480 RepID=A0ABS9Q0A9_9MICO|nr:nucleotide-binding protein [Arsenicicoccus bolidensis]MCG7321315.1 nucleotide-binding protein [Arsenicicoccus bolidensis]